MARRLLPGLLIAVALLAAAWTRSSDPVLQTRMLSHGATECDPDGVSVGYEVAFDSDSTPKGYRVQSVTVDGIHGDCAGHDIVVGLFAGADTIARSDGTPVAGSSMTLSLREHPLAASVDGVTLKIDEDILPPVEPTPTPTSSSASPSPTPSPESSATETPGPEPVVEPSPGAIVPTPPVVPDPNGSPLPTTECDPAIQLCGTTGDDHASITDGGLATGPGKDTIDVVTGPDTTQVDVQAGSGNDTIAVAINAPAGSTQSMTINAGEGADVISLDLSGIELGAIVDITILAAEGDDVIEIPSSLPPGVTVTIISGSGNDVVSASGPTQDFTAPLMFAWVSGGYIIEGNAGADVLRSGIGPDQVSGGRGADVIAGGPGHDDLRGGTHGDVIRGQSGNDRVRGGRGIDSLFGGTGDDRLFGGSSRDACRGGDGKDTLRACERRSR